MVNDITQEAYGLNIVGGYACPIDPAEAALCEGCQ